MAGEAGNQRTGGRLALTPFDRITFSNASAYIVKGFIPRSGLTVVWGAPKCGKSFFVYDLAMNVALGWEYRGRRTRQGSIIYRALEGAEDFRNRVEAFRQRKLAGNSSKVPFYLMASPMNLVADCEEFLASIRRVLGGANPAAVVIDTLNRSLAGSESDVRDMAAYIQAADAIRDALQCAVIVIHHCGREGTRPRGHSSLMGAADAQISV
ncbi:MAG: AAA family ATPase, partial [Methylocella sp.]